MQRREREWKISWKSSLMLFAAAFIWGTAFVAQSVGMEYLGPLSFNGVRFLMGGAVLLPVAAIGRARRKKEDRKREEERKKEEENEEDREKERKKEEENEEDREKERKKEEENEEDREKERKREEENEEDREKEDKKKDGGKKKNYNASFIGGLYCGLVLCAASLLQQYGILHTSVGKAGFITTLYIILVPFFGIFLKKKIPGKVWVGAAIAALGMYLLCMSESLSLNIGDGLVFMGAILFSIHILVIDYFSPRADGVELSCIQFLTAGVLGSVLALLFEEPHLQDFIDGSLPLAYAGILSCGVAYTLQVIGQKDTEPTVAALLLSLESVVSVLAGWVILDQALTGRELGGCALVFCAVILVQLPRMGKRSDTSV